MKETNQGFIKYGRPLLILAVLILVLGVGIGVVQATLLSGPSAVPAPNNVTPSGYTNTEPQVFDETQNVTLAADVICDTKILPAGTKVNSHMIIYNTAVTGLETRSAEWSFENEILCVISSTNGLYQSLTDPELGLAGTVYGGTYDGRGKENGDTVSVSANNISVTLTAEPTGDRIRVITAWPGEPADTTSPVVYCEPVEEETKGQGSGGNDRTSLVQLFGADDKDGAVDLYLTDTESGTEFGPYTVETLVSHTIGNGPARGGDAPEKKTEDVKIRTNGPMLITATDEAGNTAEAMCSQ